MNNEELLILAIEGLTHAVLDIRDVLKKMDEEGIIVVAAPSSLEN